MKPRLLMILSAAHGEEAKQMLKALHYARVHTRAYTIFAEFFDPDFESPLRFVHFPERIEKMKRGHFRAVLVMGSAVHDKLIELVEAVPAQTDVGNFTAPRSDLDRLVMRVTESPNRMWMVEAQDSS